MNSDVAVKSTSEDELSAVSQESCITPTMKPTPTTCIAISFGIPNKLHASGISSKEPPATPDAPHALIADSTLNMIAVPRSTSIPSVFVAASVKTDIVIDAPAMLIVDPRGIDTEYVSLSKPNDLHRFMLTGIFAAELLVKKAVIPLSFKHLSTSGYGFLRIHRKVMSGLTTKATNIIHPTSISSKSR